MIKAQIGFALPVFTGSLKTKPLQNTRLDVILIAFTQKGQFMQFIGIFFIIALVLEIVSVVLMGKLIGGLATFGLMILSAMFGLFLMRNNANIAKVILAGGVLKNGAVSFYELLLPIRVPVAGFMFMLPGFLSDIVGLLLLFPFKGKPVAQASEHHQHFTSGGFQYDHKSRQSNDDDVIEGDFVVRDEPAKKKNIDVIEHHP